MISEKDTDNQLVVRLPIWMRIFAGLFAAFGIFIFASLVLTGWNTRQDFGVGLGLALGFLFLGLLFLGLTNKVTLDDTLRNITIRKCVWSFPYRTRHIPKKHVQRVTTTWAEEGAAGTIYIPANYGVSIKIEGRKKPMKVDNLSRESAKYLADRINAFILADRVDPFIRFE